MERSRKRYYIKLEPEGLVEVSEEVYIVYYKMKRAEKYQAERDKRHGLLYYDSWDTETGNGAEYIADKTMDTEEDAIHHISQQELWKMLSQIGEQSDLCRFIASGRTEREIAEILGISQSTVNRNKKRIYRKLKKILK